MFIKKSKDSDDYINLSQVESLSKGIAAQGKSTIVFGMVSGLKRTWSYEDREERDRQYQNILNVFGEVKPIQGVLNEG